jgi:ribonuclease R
MQDRIGEIFTGTISGVTHFGLFVTLDGLNVDGLVHVTELPNDYFHFDPIHHRLVGERSGRTFRLADRLTVKIARVDLEQTKIDFELADEVRTEPLSAATEPPGSPRSRTRK